MKFATKIFRVLITVVLATVAGLMAVVLWRHYMLEPWTRDGRVRAEVVTVAPEVSGTVMAVSVVDNQRVQQGDVLFQIDPTRFRLAVAQAQAEVDQRRQDLDLKLADAKRRSGMTGVVSSEEIDRFRSAAGVAKANLEAADVSLNIAKLNLERTILRAPASGYVTNLRLRAGDYATAGVARVAVIDQDSFWVVGYFEETKLERIHVGEEAKIVLMGYREPLTGHVESIGRGIADANDRPNDRGLPDVNPVFTWVRLAQRIPVKLHIDHLPDGITLAAGLTCSVSLGDDAGDARYGNQIKGLLQETLGGRRVSK